MGTAAQFPRAPSDQRLDSSAGGGICDPQISPSTRQTLMTEMLLCHMNASADHELRTGMLENVGMSPMAGMPAVAQWACTILPKC
jgi:hypothetical protein